MLIEVAVFGAKEPFKRFSSHLNLFWKCHGFDLSQKVFVEGKNISKACFYTPSFLKAKQFHKDFSEENFSGLSCSLAKFKTKDWRDAWKKNYRAQSLGKTFYLIPVDAGRKGAERRVPQNKIPIYLDPQGAFGSGTHETTLLMIQMLEMLKGKFRTALDVGTGTGILAIAARHLGAARVVGIDIEKASAKTAAFNYRLNQLSGGFFKAVRGEKFPLESFDLVAANMISNELLSCRKMLLKAVRTSGYLILSGIMKENLPGFKRDFLKNSDLAIVRTLYKKEWVGLCLKKKSRTK